jgi:hypothetical protein
LVGDIAAILGPAPIAIKEAEERRRAEHDLRRESEQERFRQQELQRSEEEAPRETNEENQSRVQQEADLGRLQVEEQASFEGKPARKASLAAPRHAQKPQAVSVPERFIRWNRQHLHRVGLVAVIIGAAIMAFWSIGPTGTEDADVKKIVALGIQGERQLNPGEKTVLRAEGRFSDGSKAEVKNNLHWQSSNDSVAAVNGDGQVEARKDGSSNITVRYEGTASPPLTLLVKAENPSSEADAAGVIAKIHEHIKIAGSYGDQGEYSTALAELAKAKSLDPANKTVQAELERTKKACLAEQRIGLTNSRCE